MVLGNVISKRYFIYTPNTPNLALTTVQHCIPIHFSTVQECTIKVWVNISSKRQFSVPWVTASENKKYLCNL